MKKLTVLLMILCAWMVCAFSGAQSAGADIAVAIVDGKSSDRVHLRERPSADAKSLGLFFTGTEAVCESGTLEEWVQVAIGSQRGYMKSEFLYRGNDPGSIKPKQPVATVNGKKVSAYVNLRGGPSLDAVAIGKYYPGDTVTVLGETATRWYYVKAGGVYGYMMSDYLVLGGTVPSNSAAMSAFQAVLRNKGTFISDQGGQAVTLSQLIDAFSKESGASMRITGFALVDLDRDGTKEVILQQAVGGSEYTYGFEVLRYQDGAVYGYAFWYRAFMGLKADGTFSYSGGAADNGFATMKFDKTTVVRNELAYSMSMNDAAGNFIVSYVVGLDRVTEDTYLAAVREQDRKPDAVWHDFTDANIGQVLGAV